MKPQPAKIMGDQPTKLQDQDDDFASQADEAEMGLLAEFWDFLIHNKKWWLTPIILVLLAMGALIVLSGTAVAPFLYTMW